MKYLRRYNESNKTDTLDIFDDIITDLKDLGAEGSTESYWVNKDFIPNEPYQTVSRVEFGGAIRLYWSEFTIPFERGDFNFIIDIMKEMNEVKSKLKSLSDDFYIDWKTIELSDTGYPVEYDGIGKQSLYFTIKLKKYDEVSTKDIQSEIVEIIKPFCDKNGYTISASKRYPESVSIKMDDAIRPKGDEYKEYRDERYKKAEQIYNVVKKLCDSRGIKIKDWEPNNRFYNLETIQIVF